MYKVPILIAIVTVLFACAALGQRQNEASGSPLSECDGPILNGRAIFLPRPLFPLSLKERAPASTIKISVTTNLAGSVITTNVCSGPEELRPYVKSAASRARVNTKILDGAAVKISGVLVYKFDPEGPFDLPYELPCYSFSPQGSGILNGLALKLVKPEKPKSPEVARAGGAISVQVLIDENGDVVSAVGVSGHKLLLKISEEAAKQSKFRKTVQCGKPVKVSGVVIYNFVP